MARPVFLRGREKSVMQIGKIQPASTRRVCLRVAGLYRLPGGSGSTVQAGVKNSEPRRLAERRAGGWAEPGVRVWQLHHPRQAEFRRVAQPSELASLAVFRRDSKLPGIQGLRLLAGPVRDQHAIDRRCIVVDAQNQSRPRLATRLANGLFREAAPDDLAGVRCGPGALGFGQKSDDRTDLPRRPPANFWMARISRCVNGPSSGS